MDGRRQERARRRCLTTLLWELDQRGVRHVVFESRQHRDKDDDRMIGFARRAGWATRALRYDFERPHDECLLWLPDVVAGACAEALSDGNGANLTVLGDAVTVRYVP